MTKIEAFGGESAQRRLIALKYWLHGRNYYEALRAFEFNRPLFSGVRKDGITPEFDHQVSQVQFMRTLLPHVMYPEETISTILFHDTAEDKNITYQQIVDVFENKPFGQKVAAATERVTKVYQGQKFEEKQMFGEMSSCPISSLAKGVDRIHNFQTMVGVFSIQKQKQYIQEGVELFLPMLKRAETNFPTQEPAYKNIRTFLKSQMQLIQAIHLAHEKS